MFIDIHNHLHDARLTPFIESIFDELQASAIVRVVVNGTSEKDWECVHALAKKYSCVLPAYGLHPWYVHEASADWAKTLASYLDSGAVGVGECGLDKSVKGADLNLQESIFRIQLNMAHERKLPVFIHGIQCWGRLLKVLTDSPLPQCGFLLHGYNGPVEMCSAFLNIGAYFSFNGYFFNNPKSIQKELVCKIPLNRLLVETDAPDRVLPVVLSEYRLVESADGKELNHPANLVRIYQELALLRGIPLLQFQDTVRRNAERLLGLRFVE